MIYSLLWQKTLVSKSHTHTPGKLNRRDFLKLSGLGIAGILAPQVPDFALDASLTTSLNGMELSIPPELSEVVIPEKNENYRAPENILLEAFDLYEDMRKKERLPRIHLEKGPEYLDLISLTKKFPRMFEDENFEGFEGLHYRLYGMLLGADAGEEVKNADTPNIHGFSAFAQNGIVDNILRNPGSEMINQAQDYVCKKYNWTRGELISSIYREDKSLPEVTNEVWAHATKIVATRLQDSLTYLEKKRDDTGSSLSVSESVAYFLYQNNGDLKKSMWDTTLLLKVLARNDVDTLYANNTFDKAERIGHLFKDEFSPQISHNWLLELFDSGKIPKESLLYQSGAMDNEPGKNFMPINKAGTYYHVMNIITWAATCMDPWVVKSMVTAYYNEQHMGGIDHRTEHGIDKVKADVEAAQAADRIKRMVDWQV